MSVYALILAAGFSTRMKSRFKPLLPLPLPGETRTALAAVCGLYRSEGVIPIVIGGNKAEETRRETSALNAAFALNEHPECGMFSSIRAGAAALPKDCSMFFVHPVDIPLVRRMTVRSLLDAARGRERDAFIPTYQGQAGHPPLLPASVKDDALRIGNSGCLRDIMNALSPIMVPVADAFILRDMDTQEDYESMRALAPLQQFLSPEEAQELLRVRHVQERGQRHCLAVGLVAARFASALNQARSARGETTLRESLAQAGGICHDVCKGEPHHEAAAGRLFRGWGMDAMAHLVEDHRDMTLSPEKPITERELVFLADKYVRGNSPVPLKERFYSKMACYPDDPDAVAAIAGRMERAMAMEERLKTETGQDPEVLAREALEAASRRYDS